MSTGCARIAVPAFAVFILMPLAPETVSVLPKSESTSPASNLLLCPTVWTSNHRRRSVTGLQILIAYPARLVVAQPVRGRKSEMKDL